IAFPFTVSGVAHPAGNTTQWIVFEGQAGSVVVTDVSGNPLSTPVPLMIQGDWMNTNPKNFSAIIPSIQNPDNFQSAIIRFNDDDPSGENPHSCLIPVKL